MTLKELVCPTFIKNFSEKNDFPQAMRLTRVISILIKQFNDILVAECEVFLSILVKLLEPENPLWARVLAMETFKGVCQDAALTRSIYSWQNSSVSVFRDMITGFGRLSTEKPQSIGVGRESVESPSPIHTQGASSVSDTLSAASSTMRIQW